MIELQQDTVKDIEKVTEEIVYDLEKGNKHVTVAIKQSKVTRKVVMYTYRCVINISLIFYTEKMVLFFYISGDINCYC